MRYCNVFSIQSTHLLVVHFDYGCMRLKGVDADLSPIQEVLLQGFHLQNEKCQLRSPSSTGLDSSIVSVVL